MFVGLAHFRELHVSRLSGFIACGFDFRLMITRQFAVDLFESLLREPADHRVRIIVDDQNQHVIGSRIRHLAERKNSRTTAVGVVSFFQILDQTDFQNFMNGTYPQGMPDNKFLYPSDTVIFGEKKPSSPQYYMDLLEMNGLEGNDWSELNQATHTDGADYVFADNSARLLKPYADLGPLNLWAVSYTSRTNFAYQNGN